MGMQMRKTALIRSFIYETVRMGKLLLIKSWMCWKNSTAEQSRQKNLDLSQERAQSVSSYLLACGASSSQIKSVTGMGEENPVADNSTAAGRQENRRVEVYMYASQQMIQQAEAGTLQ